MILFGYERRESAIERYSELPLSTPLVHAVARLSLKKMAFHVVVALIGTVALLNASEKMSGFNAGVIYLLFSLDSFYVFFGFGGDLCSLQNTGVCTPGRRVELRLQQRL
jgi:hypothetical protein